MNAVMSDQEVNGAVQVESGCRPAPEVPLGGGEPVEGAASPGSSMTSNRYGAESERAALERLALTPIVPLAWVRGPTRVDPEDPGKRRAGRPKMNVHRGLTVGDLDNSILYLQHRTRELQKLVKNAQPDTEQTTRVVKAAIKDAIRRLSATLPPENRDAIDNVVAGI